MEPLKREIEQLEQYIQLRKLELIEIQDTLQKKVQEMQRLCSHVSFVAQRDGDYHRPSFDYVCVDCNLTTKTRPDGKQITY